jgi:tetratricopeptide (TPR) repeat protein
MVHEWLYHLSRLDDEQASLEVARVYLAAFWWWGCYLRFPFCERLLNEWELKDERPRVKEVAALLRAFQSSYPPEAEPEVVHEDWLKVEDSISELIDVEARAKPGIDPDAGWRRVQLRAYLETFIAHARRGQDPRDPEIDAAYGRARELLEGSGKEEDLWSVPWIVYELGDLALERDDPAEAAAKAEEAIELAHDPDLAEQDNEVVANAHRLLGDVAWREGDTDRALEQYRLAVLHAYAFQALPNPADFYTITFYRRMAEHVSERLRELPHRVGAERAAQQVSETHAFWSEYWRRVGEPVLSAGPEELAKAGSMDELMPYLLPRTPGESDVRPGADYVANAKRVAKATSARLAKV